MVFRGTFLVYTWDCLTILGASCTSCSPRLAILDSNIICASTTVSPNSRRCSRCILLTHQDRTISSCASLSSCKSCSRRERNQRFVFLKMFKQTFSYFKQFLLKFSHLRIGNLTNLIVRAIQTAFFIFRLRKRDLRIYNLFQEC